MDKKVAYIWFGALGFFLLIGFFISLANLNSTDYYQKQVYNNLPSLVDTPQPIQHYQEQVEKSVEATEQHITEQNLKEMPEGSNIVVNTGDNVNIAVGNNSTFRQWFEYREDDGSINMSWIIMFSVLMMTMYFGAFPSQFGYSTRRNMFASAFTALAWMFFFLNFFHGNYILAGGIMVGLVVSGRTISRIFRKMI